MKSRAQNEDAWRNAKNVCRLNARQVEMARALGMNPKKLPGLRPSPQQRWKLPVGHFIEECYAKRFAGKTSDNSTRQPKPSSRTPSIPRGDAHSLGAVRDPSWQTQELICYLMNAVDDLERWQSYGTVDPEVLSQLGGELRAIADAIDSGAPIPQVPGIPIPPRDTRAASPRRDGRAHVLDDDDIAF